MSKFSNKITPITSFVLNIRYACTKSKTLSIIQKDQTVCEHINDNGYKNNNYRHLNLYSGFHFVRGLLKYLHLHLRAIFRILNLFGVFERVYFLKYTLKKGKKRATNYVREYVFNFS